MFLHTIKLAFRNYRNNRSAFFINVIGLATGLACAILIFLWVHDEFSFDGFHEREDRLYQVMEHQQYKEGIMTTRSTPGLLAKTLDEEISEIDHAVTLMWSNKYTLSKQDRNLKVMGRYVSKDFFHLFTFPLIHGNPEDVLTDPNHVVISVSTAENLFETADAAIGQTIEFEHESFLKVSGIFEDVPVNSSIDFDILLPYEKFLKENEWLHNWGSNSPPTIVTLTSEANPELVNEKIADFVKDRNENSNVTLFLKPFAENYLYGRYENGVQAGGRIEYVRLFSVIAIFILLIACINFMNLSTARASKRVKEVGVKKTFGVERSRLIRQYLGESLILSFISFLLAIILVWLFIPKFNLITGKEISFHLSGFLVGSFLLITILTGLLAGSYPALYLSSFKPITVLRGDIKTKLGEIWARKGLVIFQFTLSVILIICVMVIQKQVRFVMDQNLGYDKDHLVHFALEGKLEENPDQFLAEAKRIAGVKNISTIAHDLVGQQNNTSGLNWDGKNPDDRILFEHVRVNYDLLETIGVEFIHGRPFSREYGADTSKIIFNETGLKTMGLAGDPLGQIVTLWDEFPMEIIGIVKDFHFNSLHEAVSPLFFRLAPELTWVVMANVQSGKEQETLKQLEALYNKINPGFPFEYRFVDEEYNRQYISEKRAGTLATYFAGLAILISCLGLFGLAAFTGERRKKEIGIRKVLGASVFQVVLLLTKQFTRLVLVSIVLGIPIAYWLIGQWLNRFEFKISMHWGYFAGAGLIVIMIAWLTISFQAFISASVHPNDCIRDE